MSNANMDLSSREAVIADNAFREGLAAGRREKDAEIARLRAALSDTENVPRIVMDDALAVCRVVVSTTDVKYEAVAAARRVLEWDDACRRAAK